MPTARSAQVHCARQDLQAAGMMSHETVEQRSIQTVQVGDGTDTVNVG